MRETLFRGKRMDNGEWIEGALLEGMGRVFIVGEVIDYDTEYIAPEWWRVVDPDTVGQFTGVLDKAGRRIFEGDTVTIDGNHQGYVGWYAHDAAFTVWINAEEVRMWGDLGMYNDGQLLTVTGTIHDQAAPKAEQVEL